MGHSSPRIDRRGEQVRIIHKPNPAGAPHPFKFVSVCGKLVRFGGLEIDGERPATCKLCLKKASKS